MPPRERPGADYKMALVIRAELRLTAGKAAVQVAHAAVMLTRRAEEREAGALESWLATGGKKIALTAPTLGDLEALERRAKARGIPSVWVEDAGLTEVPPGTRTCLGLGPSRAVDLDPVTGELDLL